jgi:two-component system sensor histidine kinase RegB
LSHAADTFEIMINRASLSFLRLLCNLRWAGIAGQVLTVLLVTRAMSVPLPVVPIWAAIAALAVFNVFATLRSRRSLEVSDLEIVLHLLVDIGVLAWLVAWSGGMENPFSSLFLLPIALSTLALPTRLVWVVAAACAAGYAASALFGRDLEHVHSALGDAFGLHKLGMLANFAVSAIVILIFFTRMAVAWRQSEREVARLREQFARSEGIIALATHAASVAHELNTPLGTMTFMVDDLIREDGSPTQKEDYLALKALLEVCRDRVRELAAPAQAGVEGGRTATVDLEGVIERWCLVRPTVELNRSGSIAGFESADPAVGHLLQALLNNAADAGEGAGTPRVDLYLHSDSSGLRGEIRDYGVGFEQAQPLLPATLFQTSKPDGLGIGLALSHATVERLGGKLIMQATEGHGVRVEFWLPARGV